MGPVDQQPGPSGPAVEAVGMVTLGHISAAHGIQGWVKLHSETSPRENILTYAPWVLLHRGQSSVLELHAGRLQGKSLVAKLVGCDDRDAAEALIGAQLQIPRSRLPATSGLGEFYWVDLLGLQVSTLDGVPLGRIERLFETGANDVIVVQGERERLIPYIWGQVVVQVDLPSGRMLVDWDPAF